MSGNVMQVLLHQLFENVKKNLFLVKNVRKRSENVHFVHLCTNIINALLMMTLPKCYYTRVIKKYYRASFHACNVIYYIILIIDYYPIYSRTKEVGSKDESICAIDYYPIYPHTKEVDFKDESKFAIDYSLLSHLSPYQSGGL